MSTARSTRSRQTRSRGIVLSALAVMAGVHFAIALTIDLRFPAFHDHEFYRRLELLRACRDEHPDRPLALVLGSSRIAVGVRPEVLPPIYAPDGREVLVFNHSHLAADSISVLMGYQRLRRAGIRPDYLVVEVMPSCLTIKRPMLTFESMTLTDIPSVRRLFDPFEMSWRYVRPRLFQLHRNRTDFLRTVAPSSAEPACACQELGPLGGSCVGEVLFASATPEETRRRTEGSRAGYQPHLDPLVLADNQIRAVDTILRYARADGTKAVLIRTPESSDYRSWYGPTAEATMAAFVDERRARNKVPVVDARCWLPDEDFADGHHVFLAGADRFTRLLAERVLEPLIHDRPVCDDAGR
jgi:hypothetical protein